MYCIGRILDSAEEITFRRSAKPRGIPLPEGHHQHDQHERPGFQRDLAITIRTTNGNNYNLSGEQAEDLVTAMTAAGYPVPDWVMATVPVREADPQPDPQPGE